MDRVLWAAILIPFLSACASGAPRRGSDALELLRLAGSLEANPPRDGSESFVVDTVPLPAERAFGAVRAAYSTLGISFSHFDPERLRLGGFVRELGDLGNERPSTWVDCGRGITAESYADVYEVSVAIGTRVTAVGPATSTVETVIRARGRARDVAAEFIPCRSFGTLEGRIAELVRRRALRSPRRLREDAPERFAAPGTRSGAS